MAIISATAIMFKDLSAKIAAIIKRAGKEGITKNIVIIVSKNLDINPPK